MTVTHADPRIHARRELREGVRELLKAVRLFRQQPRRSVIPTGMVGVLSVIDGLSATREAAHNYTGPNHSGRGTGGCHVKDLAAYTALDPSTISRAVGALVRLGLVRRTADPADGRASCLALTGAGREALTETHQWYDDALAGALDDWSEKDLTTLNAMLHRFAGDVLAHLDNRAQISSNTLEAAR